MQDVTESEPAMDAVVEPLSVRRGGRGRGRKGVTAKETMQVLYMYCGVSKILVVSKRNERYCRIPKVIPPENTK